jgi:hypothetical protein
MRRAARAGRLACGLLAAFLGARDVAGSPASPERGLRGVRASARAIDAAVDARLRTLGIPAERRCSDAVFLRRAHLDLIGTLPTASEARAFLDGPGAGDRGALVERLLRRPEFAEYWAMRWCHVLRVRSEYPINLWPNAVQAYHRWVLAALRDGMPCDRFARALLTSSGSNFRVPPVNFYRAVTARDPNTIARAVALTFLGQRAETWPKERLEGFSAFFARLAFKGTSEWKEEIVHFDPTKPVPARALLPGGEAVALRPDEDPRQALADWLVAPENPGFARALANRAWYWLLGRGVVHEPDDLRPDNPPSNPALLDLLARELVAGGFDLRDLFRRIVASETYQRASVPASSDSRPADEFARARIRRLEAEVLIDAIDAVTGTTEEYTSRVPEPFTVMPPSQRAIGLPDASLSSPFLDLFGRSPRASGLESEARPGPPTAEQALHLLNSTHVRRKLEQGPALRALAASAAGGPFGVVDAVYLAVLSRHPTAAEAEAVSEHAALDPGRAVADLAWALINGPEFQYRH